MTAGGLMIAVWIGALLGPPAVFLAWRRAGRGRERSGFGVVCLALFALGYTATVWGFLIEPELLAVRRITVVSAAWAGPDLKIGVVSDTHVGAPHVTPGRVSRIMARLSREAPDVVVFLGDYAGGHEPAADRTPEDRAEILSGVAALAQARAPLGRVAILGNHDWWYDGPALEAALKRAGIPVLENNALRIDRKGGPFWIAGLADLQSQRAEPAVDAALEGVHPDEPVILLTHAPDPFPYVPKSVALTLAGHTHCGQVNLPLIGRPVHASPGAARWPCGLYNEGGRQLFVTGGVGVSILPVRFRARPEVVVITLRAAGR